jgi:hypothetical protein
MATNPFHFELGDLLAGVPMAEQLHTNVNGLLADLFWHFEGSKKAASGKQRPPNGAGIKSLKIIFVAY